jgi:hypothetical protein
MGLRPTKLTLSAKTKYYGSETNTTRFSPWMLLSTSKPSCWTLVMKAGHVEAIGYGGNIMQFLPPGGSSV